MHRARRRHGPLLAVLACLIAVLSVTGCVRADADLTVEARRNTVSGTVTLLVPLTEDTPESRQAAGAIALAIENRVLPGVRSTKGVTASPAAEPGAFGLALTFESVSIDNLRLGGQQPAEQLITRKANEFVVEGIIAAPGEADVPVPPAEGERPSGAEESSITIALTFPGSVEVPRGSTAEVDGRTVVWSGPWDEPLTLQATAGATTSGAPPWIWRALGWGIGGVVVLALAGLGTLWLVSRRD